MAVLRYIATLFINFFSITQPTPEATDRAARYIGALLLAVLLFVTLVVFFAAHFLTHSPH